MQDRVARLRLPVAAQDVLLALVITGMQVQGTITRNAGDPELVIRPLSDLGNLGYALLIASGLVVSVRRRWPALVLATTALISVAYYALDFPDGPGWLGLFVAIYTYTAYGDGRRTIVLAGSIIAILSTVWLIAATDVEPPAAIGWVFFRIGASGLSAALGESVRSRRVIAADAVERAELAERTREEGARARVDEERLRIAREVHDTVAHSIAIINVQAGVTAHVLDQRPERARETLEIIEHTSSQALQEMRTILGVLRDDNEGRVPHPGLEQIDDLTAEARAAGLDVRLDAPAPPTAVPSAVGRAGYRIVQECYTNVIRHVGPTRVTVALEYDAGVMRIRVADAGPRRDSADDRGEDPRDHGNGILGMRERCQLLGGELDARPVPAGGFEVTAQLPLVPTEGTTA